MTVDGKIYLPLLQPMVANCGELQIFKDYPKSW
jgi:hypothetical protein